MIELLIVIAIIAVLVAILFPVGARLRGDAQVVSCHNNLRQIGTAMLSWTADHQRRLPDQDEVGNFSYRLKPGLRTPGDPGAFPETYGLAAVLHGIRPQQDLSRGLPPPKYLAADSSVWVCPGAPDNQVEYGNTYAFFSLPAKSVAFGTRSPDLLLVWDNHTLRPGLSGFRGPFSGYVIPTKDRLIPHQSASRKGNGIRVELRAGMDTRAFELDAVPQ
jgi:hypothetical protein